jgi:uncharacterized protein
MATRRFHVMAKPAGSACNLDCTYGYYLSKRELPGGPGPGHMSDEVLEHFVHDYIDSVTAEEVVFSWQGGEPAAALRRALQHTLLRAPPQREETAAPESWDPEQLPMLGTPESRPGHPDSVVTDWSVDPQEYGYFLCKVWDEWQCRDVGRVLVNFCETLVVQRMGQPAQVCVYAEYCGKGLAVEHDGSVYACDHYVYPECRRGNLLSRQLGSMVFDPEQVRFAYAKSEKLPRYCRECPCLEDCWGECPKNRLLRTPEGEPGLNYLCTGLRQFFAHASRDANRMAKRLLDAPEVSRPRM